MTNEQAKQRLDKILEDLNQELRSLRVGRANPALVEEIEVEAYENKMPLKEVASITIPQHNQIFIQPWDVELLIPIQQALQKSEANLNPAVEGNGMRITLPPLTEERRKELAKETHKYGENARIEIRHIRENTMKHIEESEKRKEISEDKKFKQKEEIQDLVNEFNVKIDEAVKNKEAEVLTLG